MEIFKLFGSIMVDSSKADESISKTTKKAGGFAEKLGTGIKTAAKWGAAIAGGAVVAATGFVKLSEKYVNMASDVEEMQNKFDVVFAGMTDDVEKWAKSYSDSIGRNRNVIKGYLADNQNMFVGMGMTREEGAKLAEQMVELGLDLASFNNLQEDEAVNALSKALMGESESAKNLGAVLNENTLALAQEQLGYKGKFATLTEAQKMEVRYQAILNQSQDAIGDCARSLDSYKGRQIQATSKIQEFQEKIGSYLLPIMTKFQEAIGNIATFLTNNLDNAVSTVKMSFEVLANFWTNNILPVIQFIVTEFTGFVEMIYSAVQPAIMDIVSFFQQLYEAVVNAVQQYIMPAIESYIQMLLQLYDENKDKLEKIMTLVKTIFDVIAGFVAVFIDTIKNYIIPFFAWIVSTVTSNMDSIKATIQSVINLISAIIDAFIALFTGNWKGLWESIKSILSAALDVVKNAFNTAFTFICNVFSPLKGFFSGIWNGIKGVFINAGTWFGNVFKTAVDNIKTFFSPLTDFFSQMWSKITSIFKDVGVAIGEGISGAVRNAVNGILGGAARIINGFIDAMNVAIGIVNGIPGVPDISQISHLPVPQLEKGGVLEKGEIGLLEGNGAEAVVPLDQNKKWISAVAKDMSNAIGGSNNNEEVKKTLAAVNQTLKELPKMIFNALTSGDIKFEVGSREFARLVKVVNT